MVEFGRLADTAKKLIACLREGGIRGLDETLAASRTTSGTYRYTYDWYVQYFHQRRNQELTEQDLVVGFAFAYSWMATIKQLDPALATVNSAVAALNLVHGLRPADLAAINSDLAPVDAEAMERLVGAIEPIRYFLGSVTGTSKMLHFVNPEVFPIWDAAIHRYCRMPEQTGAADSLKVYAHYTYHVHYLVSHADYETEVYQPLLQAMAQTHNAISDAYRPSEPMGKVRAAEFIMFFGGKADHPS